MIMQDRGIVVNSHDQHFLALTALFILQATKSWPDENPELRLAFDYIQAISFTTD